MRVAWIGELSAGLQVSARLKQAGHAVVVVPHGGVSSGELLRGGGPGVDVAESIAHGVRDCDVIITYFPDDHDSLVATVEGPGGVCENVPRGTLWIEMGLCDPRIFRRLATVVTSKGIEAVDAPLLGWPRPEGDDGSPRIFLGGAQRARERAQTLLGDAGFVPVPVAEQGSGHVAAMCDRILLGVILVAQSESRMIAKRTGLFDDVYRRATIDGSSNQLLNYPIENQVDHGPESRGQGPCSIAEVERVLRAAVHAGTSIGVACPITSQAWKQFAVASAREMGERSVGDVVELIAERTGFTAKDRFDTPSPLSPGHEAVVGDAVNDTSDQHVGLIGLGIIGSLIAEGLAKAGYTVVAHDLRKEAQEQVVALGGRCVDSPKEVAQQCGVVLTSLPGPDEVEAVVTGPDGLLEGMSSSSTLVEMTTSHPDLTRRLAELASKRGARIVDAAVSRGGPQGGAAGQFALWVGADKNDVEHIVPILEVLSDKLTYCGELGLGHAVKVANNYVSQLSEAITGECYVLAAALGVDPMDLYDAIWPDADGSLLFGKRWPQCALINNFTPRLRLVLGRKDLGLGIGLGMDASVPLSLGPVAFETFSEALARGYGEYDRSALLIIQEDKSVVPVIDKSRPLQT